MADFSVPVHPRLEPHLSADFLTGRPSLGWFADDGNILVLKSHSTVYFAIPKNANSSMKVFLSKYLGTSSDADVALHTVNYENAKLKEEGAMVDKSGASKCKGYFKFAIVRNPWDRLVSAYRDKIRQPGYSDSEITDGLHEGLWSFGRMFRAGMKFDDFVTSIMNIPDYISDRHFRSQYSYIYDESGTCLVDYIGRYELLGDALSHIGQQIGISFADFPHVRPSSRSPYTDYYTPKTRDLIAQRYATDLALFGYTYGGQVA